MTVSRRPMRMLSAAAVLATSTALGLTALSACGNASAATTAAASTATHIAPAGHGASATAKQIALYDGLTAVLDQHMEWTYATVVAFAQGAPTLTPDLDRLLQNQADIGNAVKPYYGDRAGNQLTALLRTHILDAVPVLQAAKDGDTTALDKAVTAWYANAKQIADFLAAANPKSWPRAEMEPMWKTHITQTITYAVDALKGNWVKSITDYDTAEGHMDQMAGMLSAGIIKQFPRKFA